MDDTLLAFTEDLKDPFCDSHKAWFRTETDIDPNVRASRKEPKKNKIKSKVSFPNQSGPLDSFHSDPSL